MQEEAGSWEPGRGQMPGKVSVELQLGLTMCGVTEDPVQGCFVQEGQA